MNRRPWQRAHPVAGLVSLVLALTLAGGVPALAGGVHTGHFGVHTLIDNSEYAGAICGYGNSGLLDKIKIRRPILFGYDRTGGVDSQKVGWRFNIEYSFSGSSWSPWSTSSMVTASATDKVNAHFKPRTFQLVNPVKTTYWRVTVDLYWFYPDVNHVNGHAYHILSWYQIGVQVSNQTWCPQQIIKTIPTPPPPGHSGRYGVHTLIDNGEYQGVTCLYHNVPGDDYLHKIIARRPVVFAFDRTAGIDSQTVGWKATVQFTDDNTTWHKLIGTPIVKATATDHVNAAFQPRAFAITSPQSHAQFRVVTRLLWYYPSSSQVNGRAVHAVAYYRNAGPSFTPYTTMDKCSNSLG